MEITKCLEYLLMSKRKRNAKEVALVSQFPGVLEAYRPQKVTCPRCGRKLSRTRGALLKHWKSTHSKYPFPTSLPEPPKPNPIQIPQPIIQFPPPANVQEPEPPKPYVSTRACDRLIMAMTYRLTPFGQKKQYCRQVGVEYRKMKKWVLEVPELSKVSRDRLRKYKLRLTEGANLDFWEQQKTLYDKFSDRRAQGFKVDYSWLRSTMKHTLRDDGVFDGWNDKSFSDKWVRKYCRRWRISKQRKRNNKEKSDAERVHQCKNHHSFQIYIAPLMLPEDVDIISSDDENILLMLPSNERKEFRKALRKEIRERDDSETESESTERESENYPDYISQSEEDTDSESECDEESEDDSEEESEEETEEES